MNLKKLISELKRRNVFKVATTYAIAGWLIIQVVTSVFPAFKFPAWTSQFVIILVFIGFPISIILAWAFELTPDGVKRTEEVPQHESITKTTGRKLNNYVIILLVLAVGVLSYKLFFSEPPSAANQIRNKQPVSDSLSIPAKSIAVLPFVNDSGESSDQYFSDGLSEELIIALSQYPGLRVIGRESSFQFRGHDLDSRAIARKLKVAHLLEGSVSREGHEVRVRAELVNATDGSTVWSQHYDRPYKNLFALQDAITHTVATALKARLFGNRDSVNVSQIERPPSGNVDAYNAYLQGTYYFNQLTEQSLRQAISFYHKAIQIDPKYTAAYARLSVAWLNLGVNYLNGTAMQSAREKGAAYADTALSLDSNSVLAHLARGTSLQFSMDWQGAEKEFRQALRLAPSSPLAKQVLAFSLATLGHLNEAIKLTRSAVETNPLDASNYYSLSQLLTGTGQLHEAKQAGLRAISLHPSSAIFHSWVALIDVLLHDPSSALAEVKAEPAPAFKDLAQTIAYTEAGKKKRAAQSLKKLIDGYAGNAAYQIADAYAYRGQPGKAFLWLNRAWNQRDPGISTLLYDPFMQRYKHDPRFRAFCKKVGLTQPESTDTVSDPLNNEPDP